MLWVLDADIKACFDTIDHSKLMGQIERRVIQLHTGELLLLHVSVGFVS